MATRITDVSRVPNQSPGIYFREVDLTVVTKSTGGFSAAAVGLMEKGPAFEISTSTSYEDRAFRMGELNPKFPTSYFAKQYLEQARNYKEVRILGLEGYKDVVGYAIMLAGTASEAADTTSPVNPKPLVVGPQGLVAVLKQRPTTITGGAAVESVFVEKAHYLDPLLGTNVDRASDYLFKLKIKYVQPTVGDIADDEVLVSLRPESQDYILTKFGSNPMDRPFLKNKIAPLWVDFIIPSVKSKPDLDAPSAYYLPGLTIGQPFLDLIEGNMAFGTGFTFQNAAIESIAPTTSKVTVTVGTDISAWLLANSTVEITGAVGTGNIIAVNGTWKVANVSTTGGKTSFEILDFNTNAPITTILPGSALSNTASPKVAKYNVPTWENEILDFSEIQYQTPITPWIISDGDSNGDYKRLFRLWSISDGESANTEAKIEIRNINPAGNNGKGTFDLVVRKWDDRDDLEPVRLEAFNNLTMDAKSDNYILRRIGDGEDFPLRSRFIFVELNQDEELPNNALPYGCTGYPNLSGNKIQDMPWTLDYDKNKPVAKQTLGLANNKVNMNKAVAADLLAFKNSQNVFGKGFHLNPANNTAFAVENANEIVCAKPTIYKDAMGRDVTPQEKVRRSKFVVHFFGGFDGFNVYSERKWNDPLSKDYEAWKIAIDQLSDKETLDADFTVLVTPDINFQEHSAACEYALEMVKERGDALYIPDLAYDKDADVVAAVDALTSSNMRSNSVALYFPWLQIEDQINKVNSWVPPSLLALGTITYVSTNESVWQPPGGSVRTVTNNLIRTRRRLKLNDREILAGSNINPITSFPGSGYEIAGVRTTQEEFSALSFVHNRLLLCYAKKVLNQTMRPLLFSLNGELTKDAFLMTVRPIFDRIKKLNGVEEYSVEVVEKDDAADRTTIYGRITIVPLYPVERIVIDFVLADGDVTYTD
jgi:hypothetical protein